MASLSISDPIAELEGIIISLKGKSCPSETDDKIQSLEKTFAVLQDAWKMKEKEIDALNDEVVKLKAGNTTNSAYERVPLESKNSKIKELEDQVTKLEVEKEILTKKVKDLKAEVMDLKEKLENVTANNKSLESDVKSLKSDVVELEGKNSALGSDVVELRANNKSLRSDVVELRENNKSLKSNVVELEGKMACVEEELQDEKGRNSTLRENLRDLQTKNTTMQEKMQKLETLQTDNKLLERKVEDLEKKVHLPDDDMVLGQLCHRVQSLIFKKILPTDKYDATASYKIESIYKQPFFRVMFDGDANRISAAHQNWTKIKNSLKWQESDVEDMIESMKFIQTQRNVVAHPRLTEAIVTQCTQRMKDAGKLRGACSPGVVMRLTKAWRQLEMMP